MADRPEIVLSDSRDELSVAGADFALDLLADPSPGVDETRTK